MCCDMRMVKPQKQATLVEDSSRLYRQTLQAPCAPPSLIHAATDPVKECWQVLCSDQSMPHTANCQLFQDHQH